MAFSPTANFVHGHPTMVDIVPTAAVNAGDVMVLNNSLRIAHRDIAANTLGAVGAGGGVYDIPNGANGVAVSDGNLIRWDATNKRGSTSTSGLKLGALITNGTNTGCTTNDATIRVQHFGGLNL